MEIKYVVVMVTILIILTLVSIALTLSFYRYMRYQSAQAAMEEAKNAHAEAKVAHKRIDRIDQEMKLDRGEAIGMRESQSTIKGWLKFIMHRDISDEIKRQAFNEDKQK